LARERSNVAYDYGSEVVTTGGSGMGFMSLIVGVERGWLKREDVVNQLLKTVKFLAKADHYHGIFPHWLNGETGKTIPFSRKDDGGDVVESAYLFQGLLCVRAYFDQPSPQETELRAGTNASSPTFWLPPTPASPSMPKSITKDGPPVTTSKMVKPTST